MCTLETSLQPRIHARSLLFEHSLEDMNELPKKYKIKYVIMEFCTTHNIMVWVYLCTSTGVVLVWVYWCTSIGMDVLVLVRTCGMGILVCVVMCLYGNRVSHIPLPASNFSTDLIICKSLTRLPSWIFEQFSFTLYCLI